MRENQHPSSAEIAGRAYEIFLASGRQPGHELDHWLQAEYELRQLPVRKIAELPPPAPKSKAGRKKSLISLVRAAMFLA